MLSRKSLLLVLAISIAGMLGMYGIVTLATLPDVGEALRRGVTPAKTSLILDRHGTVLMSYGKYYYRPVEYEAIAPAVTQALLATEDQRFFEHHGVDALGILRAMARNIAEGEVREGGSSITQQLARNLFLTNARSLDRKVRETILAARLERRLSKEEILELYLNTVYFGEGAYGIGAASEIYFGKPPGKLSIPEAALLAGLPQAPSRYNPFENPELAKARRNEVLSRMQKEEHISAEAAKKFQEAPIRLNPNGRELSAADKTPFFSRWVLKQALQKLNMKEADFWQRGIRIHTTLDYTAQQAATRRMRDLSRRYGRNSSRQQAALVSVDRQGAILAYAGGLNYTESQYDRVSIARRPAGSLFKMVVYAAALDKGIRPQTVYRDEPVRFGDWSPQNYDHTYRGYMSVARALTLSNNIVAVKVLKEIKPDSVIAMAKDLGIQAELKPRLSLALGAADVTLLEMTAAFNVLANEGVYVEPYAIAHIEDRDGRKLHTHQARSRVVLDRSTRDTLVRLLQGVMQYGTGRGAAIGQPSAGKTGTSDNYRDAWFVGFTPQLTTGVWVGNDDNSPMRGVTGGSLPAAIWQGFMKDRLAAQPSQAFDLAHAHPVSEDDFFRYDLHRLSRSERPASLYEWVFKRYPSEPATARGGGGPISLEQRIQKAVDEEVKAVQAAVEPEFKTWHKIKNKTKAGYRKMKTKVKGWFEEEDGEGKEAAAH